MKRLAFLTLLVPFFASAANTWWFERVDQELKTSSTLSEFGYSAQTPDSASFTFKYASKPVRAWVKTGQGQDAVFAFDDLTGQQSYATLTDGQWVIGQGMMMDVMQKMHRRGNLIAGNTKRDAHLSQDKSMIELVSQIENNRAEFTVLKAKKMGTGLGDSYLTISLDGVASADDAQKIFTVLRPVIERQTEF